MFRDRRCGRQGVPPEPFPTVIPLANMKREGLHGAQSRRFQRSSQIGWGGNRGRRARCRPPGHQPTATLVPIQTSIRTKWVRFARHMDEFRGSVRPPATRSALLDEQSTRTPRWHRLSRPRIARQQLGQVGEAAGVARGGFSSVVSLVPAPSWAIRWAGALLARVVHLAASAAATLRGVAGQAPGAGRAWPRAPSQFTPFRKVSSTRPRGGPRRNRAL